MSSLLVNPVVVDADVNLVTDGFDYGRVNLCVGRYSNGTPSIVGMSVDEPDLVVLSVAIPDSVVFPGCAIVDANNIPDVVEVLAALDVIEAQPAGSIRSGFVDYPIVLLTPRWVEAFDKLGN